MPPTQQSIQSWLADTRECLASPGTDYRGVTTLLFDEIGGQLQDYCEPQLDPSSLRPYNTFCVEHGTTLSGLAQAAVADLVKVIGPEAVKNCGIAIYSTSGVDEAYMQSSTIGQLASRFGFSQAPHLGLFQLQGASLPGAIDLIEAMLPVDCPQAGAMFIAAEKWPVPFPRVVSEQLVLGDGAAALWMCRSEGTRGLQVVACRLTSCDPFVPATVGQDRNGIRRIADVAASLVSACLHDHAVDPVDVTGWISSGLGEDIDRELRQRVGVVPTLIVGGDHASGYLSAAALPIGIAEVFSAMNQDCPEPSGIFVAFGVSFGGSVGVLLLRPTQGAPR